MFMQIAIGAIGIGIVLMVGYLIIAQVRTALPTGSSTTMQAVNPCYNQDIASTVYCNTGSAGYTDPVYGYIAGNMSALYGNTTRFITISNTNVASGLLSTQTTVFAGFTLIAVGIIVLAAFGLINVFQ